MSDELNIKDLQCCGNCVHGMVISKDDESYFCNAADEPVEPREWCYLWGFDKYTNAERYNEMFTPEMCGKLKE